MEDESPNVRIAAVHALEQVGGGDARAVAAAAARLTHADPEVRRAATEALGRVAGRGDWVATAALTRGLRDPAPRVRVAAAQALAELDGSAEPPSRESKDAEVQQAAAMVVCYCYCYCYC